LSENFTLRQPHRHRHAVKKNQVSPHPPKFRLIMLSETQLKVNFASSPVLYIHNFAETVVSHHDLTPDFPSCLGQTTCISGPTTHCMAPPLLSLPLRGKLFLFHIRPKVTFLTLCFFI